MYNPVNEETGKVGCDTPKISGPSTGLTESHLGPLLKILFSGMGRLPLQVPPKVPHATKPAGDEMAILIRGNSPLPNNFGRRWNPAGMTMLLTKYFSCLDALCAPSSSSEIIDGFCGGGIYNADHSIYMDHDDDDENKSKRHNQNPTDHNATVVKSRWVPKPAKCKAMVRGEVKMDDDDLDKMLEDMGK
jgi:hypothetical protein